MWSDGKFNCFVQVQDQIKVKLEVGEKYVIENSEVTVQADGPIDIKFNSNTLVRHYKE
jgi:hypothetical protein